MPFSPFFVADEALTELSNRIYTFVLRKASHPLIALDERLDTAPLIAVCHSFHSHTRGRPPDHSIDQLVRMLLVKYVCNLSLRQCEHRVRSDLVLRRFCRYTLFQPTPDYSTLSRFASFVQATCPDAFFDAVLLQIDLDLPAHKHRTQLADTFAVSANAAKESVTRLLRHGCQQLLTALAEHDPFLQVQLVCHLDLVRLFGDPDVATPTFDRNPEARADRLLATTRGCLDLLRRADDLFSPLPPAASLVSRQLHKVLADELTLLLPTPDEAADLLPVAADAVSLADIASLQLRRRRKRGSYRIGSMTDCEATFRKHNGQVDLGYNVNVAADTFVRAIHTATGAEPDEQGIVPLLTAQTTLPAQLVYDQAAGHGKTYFLVDHHSDGQTELVAHPVTYAHPTGRFDPRSFSPAPDALALTCPNGVTTTAATRSASGDGWSFRFSATQCADCPLWNRCRAADSQPTSRRAVFISDYRRVHARALVRSQQPDFQQALSLRPKIERIISHLVNHNGARRAQGRGRAKVAFQMKMCAMAYNLKKWVALAAGVAPAPEREPSNAS